MSSNMVIAIILVILAFVVFFLMQSMEKKKRVKRNINNLNDSNSNHKSEELDTRNLSKIENLKFNYLIESMKHNQLANAYEVIYDTFNFLEYTKNIDNFMKKEWHSWQISILLKYLQKKAVFTKPNCLDNIPEEVLLLGKKQLRRELDTLTRKYFLDVPIERSREELSTHLVWTGRDVSIIIYSIYLLEKENS